MKKIKWVKYVCFFLICTMGVLGGCQEKEDDESVEKEYYAFEAATEIKDGQPNVYVILKVLTSQYWQDIVRGIADAAEEKGCNVYVGASVGEGDWEIQKKLLQQAAAGEADAILMSPGNSTMLSDTVADLHNQGIPVVLIDTILNNTDSFDTCYMTDNLQAGELAAQEMIRLLRDKGVSEEEPVGIAIQIASISSQTVIDRLAGFSQYWSSNAPRQWTILDEVKLNDGDMAVAKQNCIDFLESYPEIKGVFGCNNSSTVGFVQGLTELDRKDVILIGFDYADETAALVGSEEWQASTVVQNQYNMGYEGMMKAYAVMNGEDAGYKFIDTGTRVISRENHIEYQQNLAGETK